MKTNHNQLVAGHAVPQTEKLITESADLNPRECHALACHCDMNLIGAAFVGTVAMGLALHVHLKGCKPAPPVSPGPPKAPDDELIRDAAHKMQQDAALHHYHLPLDKAIQLAKVCFRTFCSGRL